MKNKLNEDERVELYCQLIIYLHLVERIVTLIEKHYAEEYKQANDYKKLCKYYGKAKADEIVDSTCSRFIRHEEKMKVGKILKAAADFKDKMESLSEFAMAAKDDSLTYTEAFDAVQHDAKYIAELYSYIRNTERDNDIKVLSYAKLLANHDRVSQHLIELLRGY